MEAARPSQVPPEGAWRVWYVRGGRGSGKTRTGAETLAQWVRESPAGEWAIIAPTFGDAKSVCVENQRSGILQALGGDVLNWNRSEGTVYVRGGSVIFLDGADDGALRIQGRNLCGAWCDEVGLWRDWNRAWNYSLQPAVRFEPGRIVATGTPKLGHPLVAALINDPTVRKTLMATSENAANLSTDALDALYTQYAGTTLGRQELEGEFIAALEGEILKRADWRYYPKAWSYYADHQDGPARYDQLPTAGGRFSQIVHSWDTSGKGKETSDYVAGQVWGIHGADRYLLRVFHEKIGFEGMKEQIRDIANWARGVWPHVPHRVIVEAQTTGSDAVAELRSSVEGLFALSVKGDKVQRAWAASPALESHNCKLPGARSEDGTSYDGMLTPPAVQGLVEECAMFRADDKHAYDDQVDAWSQMVNYTRRTVTRRSTVTAVEFAA